jgi:hypothetical protein
MTQGMKKEPILQMGTDRMIPKHVYDKPDGFQPDRKGGIIWNTDGSRTNKGTGAWVYDYGTRRMLTFSLEKYTITIQYRIQAGVYDIKACAVENLESDYKVETSIFYQRAKLQ